MSTAPPIWSHSRMNVFEECPRKYQEEYVLRNRADRTQSNSLIIGDRCHKCIEDYRTNELLNSPSDALFPRWQEYLKQFNLEDMLVGLSDVYEDLKHILWRATAECTDPSLMIRNKDKSIPKNLGMNSSYKAAIEQLGIDRRMEDLDIQFKDTAGPSFVSVSITQCYSETYEILAKFVDHQIIQSVDYIEFPFSHRVFVDGAFDHIVHEVRLPNGELFNGYIDEVVTLIPSVGGRAIIDHKSSAHPPTLDDVTFHQQLNKYANFYEKLTAQNGNPEIVTHIGINFLRTGELFLVPVNREFMLDVFNRQAEVIDAIKATETTNAWNRRDPLGYNSPCLSKNKEGVITKMCGHLKKCWPLVHAAMVETIPEVSQAELLAKVDALPEPVVILPEGFGF